MKISGWILEIFMKTLGYHKIHMPYKSVTTLSILKAVWTHSEIFFLRFREIFLFAYLMIFVTWEVWEIKIANFCSEGEIQEYIVGSNIISSNARYRDIMQELDSPCNSNCSRYSLRPFQHLPLPPLCQSGKEVNSYWRSKKFQKPNKHKKGRIV